MTRTTVGCVCTVLLIVSGAAAEAQQKEVIQMPGARSGAPYSPAIRVGNMLYLSGQLGTVPGGGLAPGGIGPETKQAMENIKRVLEQAGSSLDRAVKCTVFLADMADYAAMNEAYSAFFPKDPPARSTIAAGGLVRGARVEIECIALAGSS